MKKFILGLLAGAILFVPATALASRFTNVIAQISDNNGSVSVFDDGNNKCYVAVGWDYESNLLGYMTSDSEGVARATSQAVAISCVKQ